MASCRASGRLSHIQTKPCPNYLFWLELHTDYGNLRYWACFWFGETQGISAIQYSDVMPRFYPRRDSLMKGLYLSRGNTGW